MAIERTKMFIVSPREPCGATWLINCFLELDILTYRAGHWQNMWRETDGRFYLTEHEDILKKWLPSLSEKAWFEFNCDIEVEWTHEWPSAKFDNTRVIFFQRDPRDAIFSRYKRESPDVSYSQYIACPEPYTLLDKIETHLLFKRVWSDHPHCGVFNFENYKKDPEQTLRRILSYIGKHYSDKKIDTALAASTSEMAKKAEIQWHQKNSASTAAKNPEVHQIMNQGGIVGRWQQLQGEDEKVVRRIEYLSEQILEAKDNGKLLASYFAYFEKYNLLSAIDLPPVTPTAPDSMNDLERRILTFSRRFTIEEIEGGLVYEHELKNLLNTLAVTIGVADKKAMRNIAKQYRVKYGSYAPLYQSVFTSTGNKRVLVYCGIKWIARRVINKAFYHTRKRLNFILLRFKLA